jgi:predicted nucleotide-binding protein
MRVGWVGRKTQVKKGEGRRKMAKTTDKINELADLRNNILNYTYLIKRPLNKKKLTNMQQDQMAILHETIGLQVGHCAKLITELTGLGTVDIHGKDYDMWVVALRIPADKLAFSALTFCIQVMDRAIGQLEEDIKTGIRDAQTGKLTSPIGKTKFEVPKAFISHGKESVALKKLEDFLHNLGIIPLIVKEQASLDKTTSDKVEYYLQQADFVIILATGDDKFEEKLHPRQNVIHEIGLAQKTHSGKIIYLLEQDTEFPSNISPKVWERFKQRNMLNAFLCILRELRALGILLAVKPEK